MRSVCPFCGVGCTLRGEDGRGRGAPGAVNRRGELCPKGVAAYEIHDADDRLTTPLVREDGDLRPASWDEALDRAVAGFEAALDAGGPDSLGFLASSNCTNEENYLLAKLARALGTNNVDNCARLCHSSTVAAMSDRLGAGAMTNSLDDATEAGAVLVWGANPVENHPVAYSSYLNQAVKSGAPLVVADPRETKTVERADIHLQLRPGYDIPLLNALCAVVVDEGLWDESFVAARTEGFESFADALRDVDIAANAELAGVAETTVREAARAFAGADAAATYTGMGTSQHHYGTLNVHALCNLVLLTGNLGKPGAGLNPLRGQNNVQGASDVGALPDLLPGYRSVADADARAALEDVWGFEPPAEPGLTEVELTHAFGDDVRAAFVFGENPAVTEPNASRVRDGLDALDTLVVLDVVRSETVEYADVVLPGSTFAEKTGTYTNTDRQVQRLFGERDPSADARRDFDAIGAFARRLTDDVALETPEEAFEELVTAVPQYAGMSYDGIGEGSQRWPFPEGAEEGEAILHRETFGGGREHAEFRAVGHVEPADDVADDELALTTGRVLQHFNSGAVTRRSPTLSRLYPGDALSIHPADAEARDIADGDPVVVENDRGRVETTARVTDSVRPGVVFLTFHFAEPLANELTGDELDPEAKIPEYKHTAVTVRKP